MLHGGDTRPDKRTPAAREVGVPTSVLPGVTRAGPGPGRRRFRKGELCPPEKVAGTHSVLLTLTLTVSRVLPGLPPLHALINMWSVLCNVVSRVFYVRSVFSPDGVTCTFL